ncbi:hypothetical protein [Lentzea sp. NPDC051838]|uniref:hypothetical protein n=1 Tax=Lentzea sp. NPDC051838 TaxID=3154849 RepID=UPI003435D77C
MERQAARFEGTCGTCGAACTGWAEQFVEKDGLRWALDLECTCGTASCDRGRGTAQAAVREEILARHGTYRLQAEGAVVLKAIRSAFGLSIAEAQRAARAGYSGTLVEVRLLAELVRRAGVPAALDRDDQ